MECLLEGFDIRGVFHPSLDVLVLQEVTQNGGIAELALDVLEGITDCLHVLCAISSERLGQGALKREIEKRVHLTLEAGDVGNVV